MVSVVVEWRYLNKSYRGVATQIESSGGPIYRVDFTVKGRVTPAYLIQLRPDVDKNWKRLEEVDVPGFDSAFLQEMGMAIERHPSFPTSFK